MNEKIFNIRICMNPRKNKQKRWCFVKEIPLLLGLLEEGPSFLEPNSSSSYSSSSWLPFVAVLILMQDGFKILQNAPKSSVQSEEYPDKEIKGMRGRDSEIGDLGVGGQREIGGPFGLLIEEETEGVGLRLVIRVWKKKAWGLSGPLSPATKPPPSQFRTAFFPALPNPCDM